MPELPDLEVFAANLEKRFKHKTLERLEVQVAKKLNVPEKELKETLEGHQLTAVKREGKTIQLHFGPERILGLHLMLHGALNLIEADEKIKYPIVSFHFKTGHGFALTDFQKAATLTLNPVVSDVPDALSKEMSVNYLEAVLAKKKAPIKTVLMDQHLIRGIGNTYADEILWEAGISPFSVSKAIPKAKVRELHQVIGKLLRKEIQQISKMLPDELGGEIKDFLKIHGAGIKESPTGKKILVEEIGGRKSYYTEEQELY
ncbi:Fpg/Nei family DNA glycosylase [Pedobacter heparinus]|uniref:DNA-formamidopyrimidine glycosylase n=1 Tax=Pedobacter heparinus (strain ATCC 13125 / DSM 2366 / CIP 104194 / JCM 7457 / NBRC 12017 / NCIMB 9290 / NRRL B-14731 / HIM 762-3) TaxID=485917 RepID=C6XV83_PEDHD|nr:DNA-formamidopyrimidine glycosylase family protein [Pedobacter heparinus]ACU03949.1 DNA-formamidopyrimidine glycosylase [Pedobacter heparinus DSM 2366]